MKKGLIYGLMSGIWSVLLISFVSAASKWSVTDVLNTWASAGIFKYILPFLLVFALIFGLLSKSQILGDNRGVQAIIAIALGLLSLVGDYFPNFIEKMAPNLAVAISVLVAAIVLLGLFYDPKDAKKNWIMYIIFGVSAIAFVVMVADTFSGYSGVGYNVWDQYGPALVTLLILGGIIWAVVANKKP